MDRALIDEWIHAKYREQELWSAVLGNCFPPDHVYHFTDMDTLMKVSKATGVQIRKGGTENYGCYQLDYNGCLFQAARKDGAVD